ncbi:MAG: EamA family transporter [Phycisphaerales bacterium]
MLPILFAILAGLCWGVGEIFTKAALNSKEVGPMAAFLVRALVTLPLALLAYFLASRFWTTEVANEWRTITGPVWLRLILGSGVLAGFAGVFFFYAGLSMPGGDISRLRPIAFSLAPASAVVLGWIMLGEPMTPRKIIAVVLILLGIVMLAGESHAPRPSDPAAVS